MANYYNLDGVKKNIEKEIEANEKLLEVWEKVTFPIKKDGKPFATMSKNISGATYRKKRLRSYKLWSRIKNQCKYKLIWIHYRLC